MINYVYAGDKPQVCQLCTFWSDSQQGCSLGDSNCYYLLHAVPRLPPMCIGCPYIKDNACVGSCYKRLLPELWGGDL